MKSVVCFVDVAIDIPDVLDLSALRGMGLQPGEEELPTAATQKKGKIITALYTMLLYVLTISGFDSAAS